MENFAVGAIPKGGKVCTMVIAETKEKIIIG
jgi:hypothetical protein